MRGTWTSRTTAAAWLVSYLLFLGIIVFASRLSDLGLPQLAESTLERLHAENIMTDVRFGHVEAAANVLLFIPVGLLVARMLPRRHWWIAIATGVLLSLSIELLQAVALSGRSSTPRDVVCNSLGAIVGALITATMTRRPAPPFARTAGERT